MCTEKLRQRLKAVLGLPRLCLGANRSAYARVLCEEGRCDKVLFPITMEQEESV